MAKDIYFNNPENRQKAQQAGFKPPKDFCIEPMDEFEEITPKKAEAAKRAAVSQATRKAAKEFRSPSELSGETIANENYRAGVQPNAPAQKSEKQQTADKPKKKKKKKHVFAKVLCVLLVLIIALGGAVFGVAGIILKDYAPESLKENQYVDEASLMHSKGIYNVLLLGIDTMDTNASSRSDAMIVMSVDSVHSRIKLTSFMRDMYVTVPGHGDTKLTHACQYGGPQLVADTIEYNFGIKINAYAKIGYDLLIELVNGVGGVTVPEISDVESSAMAYEGAYVNAGTNVFLTGEQALQYCRIRRGQSDFQRTERQREMIGLVIKKMLTVNPADLVKLASSIASEIQCSISKTELYTLAFRVLPCLTGEIQSQQIPADGTWENATRSSMAVLLVNTDANRQVLKQFIYE